MLNARLSLPHYRYVTVTVMTAITVTASIKEAVITATNGKITATNGILFPNLETNRGNE